MIDVTVSLAFLAGLLSFASPCVLPLVPAYLGYLANHVTGQTLHDLNLESNVKPLPKPARRYQMALHGIAFMVGFTFIFVVFGLVIDAGTQLLASTFYDVQRVVIPRVGGILIMLFGLHFLGVIGPMLRWLESRPLLDQMGVAGQSLKRAFVWLEGILYADTRPWLKTRQSYGLLGSSLMGVVFAAGWTPCIGPIYGTLLTMAATGTTSLVQVGGLMTVYSLGLGLPFIFAAVALDRAQGILRRVKRHLNTLKWVSGLFLIGIGLLVYTGELQRLSQFGSVRSGVFMYKVEECMIQVYRGKLSPGEMGTCIDKQP